MLTSEILNKRLSTVRLLAVHGVYWLILATVLDYASAWVMMWFRGSASEGNTAMVLLFEHPGFVALLVKLSQEYAWFGLGAAGVLCALMINSEKLKRAGLNTRRIVLVIGLEVGFVIWLFAALRLSLGAASNIFNIFYSYGGPAGLAGSLLFFLITLAAMYRDLKNMRGKQNDSSALAKLFVQNQA